MDKSQMFPFERNRYYYGKFLSSEDFEAEQQYMNTKRFFLNQMVLGRGILCGLKVSALNDTSVLVENGAAIDSEGREIILEDSEVVKLSAFAGYEDTREPVIGLYLRYREKGVKPVYAANRRERQEVYENNRIREGYEFFVEDRKKDSADKNMDRPSFFYKTAWIVREENFLVRIKVPAYACTGGRMKVMLEFRNISEEELQATFTGMFQLPVFLAEDGTHQLKVDIQKQKLEPGEEKIISYWVYTQETDLKESCILLEPEECAAEVGTKKVELDQISVPVMLTEMSPKELVRRMVGSRSMEESLYKGRPDIHLADIHISRTEESAVIDHIEEAQEDAYICLPAKENEKAEYLRCYEDGRYEEPVIEEEKTTEPGKEKKSIEKEESAVAGGIVQIPLEAHMKKGNICLSREILHGLGPGFVYVAVGTGNIGEYVNSSQRPKTVIYGDMSLFAERDMEETWVDLSVKVFQDKGSFQVAARLRGEQKTVLLTIPWVAVRVPEVTVEKEQSVNSRMQITPETSTVRLAPKEKHYFGVRYLHMKPCKVVYELTEADSGRIEPDGTYTAPSRPGVYEIKIYCEERPDIRTYAYAVVERGGKKVI